MHIRILLAACAVTLAAAPACNKRDEAEPGKASSGKTAPTPGIAPQSEAELSVPLATIDDVTITVGELQERINRQSPHIRNRYTSKEQKLEFLDSLIRFEVLAKEAHARGFDKDPDVIRTMKQVMIQKLMKDQFENKLTPESITDDELRKYFEDHKNEYNKPEEVRAAAIVLKSKGQADKIATRAAGDEGKTNKSFRELVNKYSTDEKTKVRGGDLRYFSRASQELPKPVIDAAFGLTKTGDVVGPVDGGNGNFYILKLTGKRKAITKTFEQVKRQIKNRLYRERRTSSQKEFIANLKKGAKIEVFKDNLGKVRIDTSKAASGHGEHGHGGAAPPNNMPSMPNPTDMESTSDEP